MRIKTALREARAALEGISASARLDAEILLAFLLKCPRALLAASGDQPLSDAAGAQFRALIDQRAAGMPVAYLTGRREFWSLDLAMTRDVLVPRPETEGLIERALELFAAQKPCEVLDMGTGSGAIAIAIAHERPLWQVTGVDISQSALDLACANALRLGLTRIEWRLSSWFDALEERRFDLILCNPPYIAAGDPHLAALQAEPKLALTPGVSGLEAFQAIIPSASSYLTPTGWIVFEHGATQAAAVANLLEQTGFHHVTSHADFAGLPRITQARVCNHNRGSP